MRKMMIPLVVLALTTTASPGQDSPQAPLIYVTGDAQQKAQPDLAIVNLGVVTQARSVAEARQQNAVRMQAIMDAIRKLGVPAQDISSTRLNVTPQYDYQEKRNPPPIVGYSMSHQVTVRLEDIDKLSDVLDGALAAGANSVNSLDFTLKDARKLRIAAYDEAVRDARSKAEALAKAAGVQLGGIRMLRESGGTVMPLRHQVAMMAGAKFETPIQSGEVTVQVNVEIQFEIKQ